MCSRLRSFLSGQAACRPPHHAPAILSATFGRLATASLPTPAPVAAVAASPPAASLLLSAEARFEPLLLLLPGVSISDDDDDDDLGAPKKLVNERCGMVGSGCNDEFATGAKSLEGVLAVYARLS